MAPPQWSNIISGSVVPVVIISACGFFAAAFFVLGLLCMLCGVISAMLELRDSLEQVEFDGHFVFQALEPSLSDLRSDSSEV